MVEFSKQQLLEEMLFGVVALVVNRIKGSFSFDEYAKCLSDTELLEQIVKEEFEEFKSIFQQNPIDNVSKSRLYSYIEESGLVDEIICEEFMDGDYVGRALGMDENIEVVSNITLTSTKLESSIQWDGAYVSCDITKEGVLGEVVVYNGYDAEYEYCEEFEGCLGVIHDCILYKLDVDLEFINEVINRSGNCDLITKLYYFIKCLAKMGKEDRDVFLCRTEESIGVYYLIPMRTEVNSEDNKVLDYTYYANICQLIGMVKVIMVAGLLKCELEKEGYLY